MSSKEIGHHLEDVCESSLHCGANDAASVQQANELVPDGDLSNLRCYHLDVAHGHNRQIAKVTCTSVRSELGGASCQPSTVRAVCSQERYAESFNCLSADSDIDFISHGDKVWNDVDCIPVKTINGQFTGNGHHFHGSNPAGDSLLTTAHLQPVNSESIGAVGGYVNGFSVDTRNGKPKQSADRRTDRCTKKLLKSAQIGAENVFGGFSVISKSKRNFHLQDQCTMKDLVDDGVFDYHVCDGNAPNLASCYPAASNYGTDVCLDDYIDADMHMSPVAGSLSRSSSSLSDDSDILVNKSEDRITFDGTRYNSLNGISSFGAASHNGHSDALPIKDTDNCYVPSNCSAFEDLSLARKSLHVANVVPSSGHPSTSSFDSLPASLPSPCGNVSDFGVVPSASKKQFFFTDVQSNSIAPGCSLLLQQVNEISSHVTPNFQNESYWLSMSGNSDLDSPGSDCKACLDALHPHRTETCTRQMDEPDVCRSQKRCACSSTHDNRFTSTYLSDLQATNSACLEDYDLIVGARTVYNGTGSTSSTYVNGSSCDRQKNQISKKYLLRQISSDSVKMPLCSFSHKADFQSSMPVVSAPLDRNSNRCYTKADAGSSSAYMAMRLSTSLTFENSKVDCDERLTQSCHQPSNMLSSKASEDDDKDRFFQDLEAWLKVVVQEHPAQYHILSKSGCRFNPNGKYSAALKEPVPLHSTVSLDVGSPYLRVSPLASDRINITKLMRSLGVRDHQIEISNLLNSNSSSTNALLCNFLFACSCAGTSAQHIITEISKMTSCHVFGKFFNFYPRRQVDLRHWLTYWLKLGAIPLVTVKMNRGSSEGVKLWQHLVVDSILPEVRDYSGVGFSSLCILNEYELTHPVSKVMYISVVVRAIFRGINLGCPSELITDDVLLSSLSSGPTVEVARNEIISRWNSNCNLSQLITCTDSAWQDLNVLGQTVNVLRENQLSTISGYRPQCTPFIVLPTHLRSGVTIFCIPNSPAHERLLQVTDDLPLSSAIDCSVTDTDDNTASADRDMSSRRISTHPHGRLRRKKKSSNV